MRHRNQSVGAIAFNETLMTKMAWNSNSHRSKFLKAETSRMGGFRGKDMQEEEMRRHERGLLTYLMARHDADRAAAQADVAIVGDVSGLGAALRQGKARDRGFRA